VAQPTSRLIAFGGLVGVLGACLISRGIQNFLPERPRPLYEPDLHLTPPAGLMPGVLSDFSSFPSDTASLAFSLATVIWLRSRRWGMLAYFWSFVAISLPRIYVGFHYPLDILGGAVLGITLVLLATRSSVIATLYKRYVAPVEAAYTGAFYAAAFLLTYQLGSLFEDARRLGSAFATFLKLT
jgi:undecaprenyl-diphosphatase